MNKTKVRLIFNPSIRAEERQAALDGARRFAAYGVECDCMDADAPRRHFRRVRLGQAIRRLALEEKYVVLTNRGLMQQNEMSRQDWLFNAFFTKDSYCIGFTPQDLAEVTGQLERGKYKLNGAVGLALPGQGAIMTVYPMRERGEDDALATIRTATMHELGHVFGISPHCTDATCVMQANTNFGDFVERLVKPGLDFCRGCQAKISRFVCRERFGF